MSCQISGTIAVILTATCAGNVGVEAPDPGNFAILPWGWLNDASPEALAEMKACGFNLAGFVAPEHVEAVAAAGLKAFVSDGRLLAQARNEDITEAEARALAEEVSAPWVGNPAVFGYYIVDEPSARFAPNLGILAHAVKAAHPGAIPYVNLLPTYASAVSQLEAETYEAYLEAFAQALPPDYLSYDHYALMTDGSLRDGYFQNLESMRKVTLAHGIPFWNIVLSNAHFCYAEPTPAGFRFQAYTSLAYGARGISYFTYFTPHIGNYRLAPIDPFGNKTPTWYMLREVNLELHQLAPIYNGLESINVFHMGAMPEGCQDESTAQVVSKVTWSSDYETRTEQTGVVVGEFKDQSDTPYAIVVNKSLHDSISFEIAFKKEGPVERISPYDGQPAAFGGEQKWLAPGQGMLLRVKP
jgi:hypothetical protein